LYSGGCEGKAIRKGAAIQRGLKSGSRGIATVKAVTRQILVKALEAGKDLACALVIFKMWKLSIEL
jgi:hypothetical protein